MSSNWFTSFAQYFPGASLRTMTKKDLVWFTTFSNVLTEVLSKRLISPLDILTLLQTTPRMKKVLTGCKQYNNWKASDCDCDKCYVCALNKLKSNVPGYQDRLDELFGSNLEINMRTNSCDLGVSQDVDGRLRMKIDTLHHQIIDCPQVPSVILHVVYSEELSDLEEEDEILDITVNNADRVTSLIWESNLGPNITQFTNLTSLCINNASKANIYVGLSRVCNIELSILPPNLESLTLHSIRLCGSFSEKSSLKHFVMSWYTDKNIKICGQTSEIALPHTLETFVTMDCTKYKFVLPPNLKCFATNVTATGTFHGQHGFVSVARDKYSIVNTSLPETLEIFVQFSEPISAHGLNSIYHHSKKIFTKLDEIYVLGVDLVSHINDFHGKKYVETFTHLIDFKSPYFNLPQSLRILCLHHRVINPQTLPKLETLCTTFRLDSIKTLQNITAPNLKSMIVYEENVDSIHTLHFAFKENFSAFIKLVGEKYTKLQHFTLWIDSAKVAKLDVIPLALVPNFSVVVYGIASVARCPFIIDFKRTMIIPTEITKKGKDKIGEYTYQEICDIETSVADVIHGRIKKFLKQQKTQLTNQVIKVSTSVGLDLCTITAQGINQY
jgi:hypothetical protein